MLNIKRILLPVDIPIASLDVIYQAAILARHFKSEIVMLHVVTAKSHAAGVPNDSRDLSWLGLACGSLSERPRIGGESSNPGRRSRALSIRGKSIPRRCGGCHCGDG